MLAVIDYGTGNLRSVAKALRHVAPDLDVAVTADAATIRRAERIVLPGQSAMPDCMRALESSGLAPLVIELARERPFLGICLGLQLLFTESEEFGRHQGLGIIPGKVVRFPDGAREASETLKVPHMGWNRIGIRRPVPLYRGVPDGSFVYFVHSYYVVPDDSAVVATETGYGQPFCSSIWRDNVMATQFHPEKSQAVGLQMLRNFGDM